AAQGRRAIAPLQPGQLRVAERRGTENLANKIARPSRSGVAFRHLAQEGHEAHANGPRKKALGHLACPRALAPMLDPADGLRRPHAADAPRSGAALPNAAAGSYAQAERSSPVNDANASLLGAKRSRRRRWVAADISIS